MSEHSPTDQHNHVPESKVGDYNRHVAQADGSQHLPANLRLLHVWLLLGMQSFGGGAATLALMHRAMVEEQRWVSEADFSRDWALVQIAPGINLLALTILLGRRVAGKRGVALALFGLLLPSVSLTILLTAGFAHVQHSTLVQGALRGVLPATVGVGLLTAIQMARALLQESRKEGSRSLAWSSVLLVGSAATSFLWHGPILAILLGAGALCAIGRASFLRGTKAEVRADAEEHL